MATITSTVKATGGDYNSRSDWWAAKGGADLVTATNIEEAACDAFSDTTAFSMTTGTTNASYYYRIYSASGQEHTGTFGTGARLEPTVTYGYALTCTVQYTRIENQVIDNLGTTNAGGLDYNSSDNQYIVNSLVRSGGTTSNRYGLNIGYCLNAFCHNNVVVGYNTVLLRATASTGELYNCTAIQKHGTNSTVDIASTSGLTVKNMLAQGAGTNFVTTSYTGTASNNLSQDTTAPGTSAVTSTALTFTDAANDDYSLASGDTAAHTAGIGPSSDASVQTTDCIGTSRSGTTCSIGAFEYVTAGGGGILAQAMTYYMGLEA